MDLKFYIDNKKVDIDDNLNLSFQYQLEDFGKPTNIKNYYTKSVTIQGTKNNNAIFGDIYKFDRQQILDSTNITGVYFNPSKRTPFQIFKDNNLLESGYIQLQSISVKDKVIQYNIVLYGGVGDFFYNLMYNENGEKLTLADLVYDVEDDEGNIIQPIDEFNFRITKDFVYKCFNDINNEGNKIQNFITFVPSYNGLYEDYNNDNILINTNESKIFDLKEYTDKDKVKYTTFNGYAVGELNKQYTEWELKDLRSYMQRPAIKLSKLINTICKSKNNGGYEVDLDKDFFNENNPYWNDTFIALPMFNSDGDTEDDVTSKDKYLNILNKENLWVGVKDNEPTTVSRVKGESYLTESGSTNIIIDNSEVPFRSLVDITVPISLKFTDINNTGQKDLYLSTAYDDYLLHTIRKSYGLYIKVYDAANDELLSSGNGYLFSNKTRGQRDIYIPDEFFKKGYVSHQGHFIKNDDNTYFFIGDYAGGNTFNVKIENVAYRNKYKIEILFEIYRADIFSYSNLYFTDKYNYGDFLSDITTQGFTEVIPDNEKIILTAHWGTGNIISNYEITKKKLLKTEDSPADFLIDYCKMFGLYFDKDIHQKKVSILTRNNFFKNKINNFQNRIDFSKDINIEPILFNKKFYKMALETPETYYAKKYKNEYNIDYGQQRMATQYQFNNDTEKLFDDSIYENTVTAEDKSTFYRNFFDKEGNPAPCFLLDNIKYTLYNGIGTDDEKTYDTDISGVDKIDLLKTVTWNSKAGYDCFPKLCCYSLNKEDKSLEDLSNSLVFYNGNKAPKDIQGNKIQYYLTDDVTEMNLVSDDDALSIYTESEYAENGQRIAIFLDNIPQFTKYIFNDAQQVQYSLDFGLPRQFFINNIDYTEDKTIYYRYHRNMYLDQFNVNTKKVTAYCKINDLWVNNNFLKEFYYFNNAIWIINKINNYNPLANTTVQIEFIKVQDTQNYLNGQNI